MADPRLETGGFIVDINRPRGADLQGPSMGFLGTYKLVQEASIKVSLNGKVFLPSGNWEVGLVRNLVVDIKRHQYSNGGFVFWSWGGGVLLDSGQELADVWQMPVGVQTFRVSRAGSRRLFLDTVDGPEGPAVSAMASRCGNTIKENLLWCYAKTLFRTILMAREGGRRGRLLPLATTDLYGYKYLFTVGSGGGQPDDDWLKYKEIFPKVTWQPPQFLDFLNIATSPPYANAKMDPVVRDALRGYDSCNQYLGPFEPAAMGCDVTEL